MNQFFSPRTVNLLIIGITLVLPQTPFADKLDEVISIDVTTHQSAAESQSKIDKLSDQTRRLLNEYRQITRETEVLTTYNDHLRQLLVSQKKGMESLSRQLKTIEVTQREIVPLMLRMLDSLDAFVKLDFPFLPEERSKRIAQLRDMVVRADVTDSEKYRRILEAFQIETEYGRTIEAYRADLKANGKSKTVDFLRLGRIALYYQALDGNETGVWNRISKTWDALPAEYRKPIRNGLRIARKQTAPDLLTLPVSKPEAVK